MPHSVRELCLEAYVTSGVQLHPRLLLLFTPLTYRVFQHLDFILLPPVVEAKGSSELISKWNQTKSASIKCFAALDEN